MITVINAQSYGVQKKEYDPDIFGDYWSKKVEIYSEGDERYSYVPVLVSVPEDLTEINLYKEFSDGSQQRVNGKSDYEFEIMDQDDDGLVDHVSWIASGVTRNVFVIEGKLSDEDGIIQRITTTDITTPKTTIIPTKAINLPSTTVKSTTSESVLTIVTTSSVISTEESTSTIGTDYTTETPTSKDDPREEIIEPKELMLIQGNAEVNKPVEWQKVVSVKNEQVDTKKVIDLGLPIGSNNVKVKRKVKLFANLEWRRNVDFEIIMDPSDENKIKLKFSEQFRPSQEKEYVVNFETPGPKRVEYFPEETDDEWKKEVRVVSDTSVHYKDVLSYTEIKESERDQIHLYWLVGGEKVDVVNDQRFNVKFLDTNNNGLIDRLEWVVPQLSEQIFLVEIDITVLNPYTYLRDGDIWTVAFNTTGTANLSISSPNAGWTEFLNDNPDTFDEMEFLDISCGDESLKGELKLIDFDGNIYNYKELDKSDSIDIEKLLIKNYYCEDTGYFSNYMIKAGYATLGFEFSNQNENVSDYAYDPEINYVEITPNPAYTNDTLNCLFNITEPDSAYVNVTWFVDKGSGYEAWSSDNQNEISVTTNINTSTNSTGDIEYNNSHHDYSWICQVTAWNSTDTNTQNSSALTISNYSTSMTIENDTGKVVNEQVYFYANYTSDKIGDIGGLVWNKTNPDDIISIAVFDYDGDGKRDEIVINQNSPPRIKAYFSNGTEIWSSDCTGEGYEIEIFDGNNDSYDDIVALGYTGGFCIFNRTGDTINSSDSPNTPSSIISGDFDGDGLEDDIAIGAWNSTNNVVYMFRSNGTNWELNWTSKSFGDNAINERIYELDSYDIEDDGIDEIIGPSYEGGLGGCFVLHGNNGTVKWEYVGNRMLAAAFLDLDHDGRRDEAVCSGADNPFQLYYFNELGDNILNGTLWEPSYETGIVDADDDGWEDDIIVGSFRAWDDTYKSYIMAFDNSSNQLWNYSDDSGSGTTNRYYSMSIGDVNDDGIKDVIGADQYQHKIHALDAHGNFLFTRVIGEGSIGTNVGTEPSSRTSDSNDDGINDIITGHDDGSDGYIYVAQEVSCIIHFNDSSSANMTWNQTSGKWYYNRTFGSTGGYSWNVTCSKGGYDSQFSSSDLEVDQDSSPKWSSNLTSPSSPVDYSPDQSYQLNVTWSDDVGLDTVQIEHNLTGSTTPHNDSFTGNEGSVFYFDVSDLLVGTYVWRSFANDTAGNENVTYGGSYWSYTVSKGKPVLTLDNNTDSVTVNTSGLIGYWRLESFNSTNGTADYSGYDNDGIGHGFDTDPAEIGDGYFGNGVDFDGDNDYILVPGDDFDIDIITVEAWIKPANIAGGTARIFHRGEGSTWAIFQLDDSVRFLADTTGDGGAYLTSRAMSILEANKWYHVAGVYNGTHMRVYVNGDMEDEDPQSGAVDDGGSDAYIGADSATDEEEFNGTIDEVRVWNRALSTDEIKELYESRVNYGTATTFTGTCPGQLTCNFYRNTTDKLSAENGTATTIGAGYHYYVFNTSGNANYTRSSILLPLNVSKGMSNISLFINSTEGGTNINNNTAVNITVVNNVTGVSVYLDTNRTDWSQSSDTTPYENTSEIMYGPSYGSKINVTGWWNGNENYTSDSQTYYINITEEPNNAPTINTAEIVPNPAYTNDTLTCNFNISDQDSDPVTVDVTWFRDKGSGYEAWTIDDENDISVTLDEINTTTSTGDVEYNNSHHDYSWICQVTADDGTDTVSSNSSALTVSNYSTSMNIENDTDKFVNEQVYFYANYTSDKIGDIGQIVWNTGDLTTGSMRGSIAFFDYDNDGKRDEVVASRYTDGVMHAFYSNGTEINEDEWPAYALGGRPTYKIDVFDPNNDSEDELISISEDVLIYNRTGSVIWNITNEDLGLSATERFVVLETGDLDNDGLEDDFVVALSHNEPEDGMVFAFNTSDGITWSQMWNRTEINGSDCGASDMDISDIDGDGEKDIIFTNGECGQMFVFHGLNGSTIWNTSDMGYTRAVISIDLDNDNKEDEIVVLGDLPDTAIIQYYNETGDNIVNITHGCTNGYFEVVKGDFDDDGWEDDIVIQTRINCENNLPLEAYNETGDKLWTYPNSDINNLNGLKDILASDINDDGLSDVIAGGEEEILWAVDSITGDLIFRYDADVGQIGFSTEDKNSAIDSSDINDDSINDIAVSYNDGYVYIYQEVSCEIYFNDSTSSNMTWNQTSGKWYYNKTFGSGGGYKYNITCSKGGYDSQYQEEEIEILSNNAPSINQIQCAVNTSDNWQSCDSITWSDTITRIRANCTDSDGNVKNVTYNLTNIPDMNNSVYSNNASSVDTDWWIYDNTDILIEDSGYWNLTIECVDDDDSTSDDNVTWEVDWGHMEVSLVTPTSSTNVSQNYFFTFTSSMTCVGGECGGVEVTLDPWANSTFERCKNITISNVGSSTLTRFPAYINLTKDDDMLSNYHDLRFYSSSCGNDGTELAYEIENYTADNAHVWLEIPSLPAAGTIISVYYKNKTVIEDGQNATGVWDDGYVGVWHLSEGSGNAADSTSNGNTATSGGSPIYHYSGKMGPCVDLSNPNGNDGNYFNPGDLDQSSNFTVEYWANHDSVSGWRSTIMKNYDYGFEIDASGNLLARIGDTSGWTSSSSSDARSTGLWYYSVMTWDESNNNQYLYTNGTESSSNLGMEDHVTNDNDFLFGGWTTSSEMMDGRLDEVRISSVVRSSDWINQSYQMVQNQDTFVTEGSEEESTKSGAVSTSSGDTPFYTTDDNPQQCVNMRANGANETCETSWQVNATGDLDTSHEFYVLYNLTDYSSYVTSNETDHIYINISSNVGPTFTDVKEPTDPSNYSPEADYQFNVTVTDSATEPSIVFIEFNDTGGTLTSLTNFTMSNESSEYYYTFSDLPVGTYNYRFYTNDTADEWNDTSGYTFTVDKAKPVLTLDNNTDSVTVNTSGLIGYWRLESFNSTNGTEDYSGFDNDAVAENFNSNPASTVSGRFGQGVDFDGDNDYIDCGNDQSLNITGDEISLEAWAKYDGSASSVKYIISKEGGPRGYSISLNAENKVYFALTSDFGYFLTSDSSLSQDVWYHIVATYNGSLMKIYINGFEDGSTDLRSGDIHESPSNVRIGVSGSTGEFNGTIDEVRVWNRSLSTDEIKELYESRINYGTSTIFTGTCPNQLTCNFYRNTTDRLSAENGTSLTIPAGYHYYVFNTSGGQNYTKSSVTLPLKVDKIRSVLTLDNNTDSVTVNTSGLVGYWRLEYFNSNNLTEDYSGFDNDAVAENFNSNPASTVSGRFGQGVDFDGDNDYIDCGNDQSLNITGDEISLEAWAKYDGSASSVKYIISKEGGPRGYSISLNAENKVYFALTSDFGYFLTSDSSLSQDVWYHIVATYNGSLMKIYINGTQEPSTFSRSGDIHESPSNVRIGVSGSTGEFNGTIDEVRVWNRSLSTDEIKELYESRINYGTSTIFTGTCNQNGNCNFYRNSTDKLSTENGTAIALGSGYYYYLLNNTDTENYTKSSILLPLNVNRATPSFSTSVSSSLDYGNPSDYSGSESNSVDSDCTYELLRNGSSIDSGSSVSDTTVLAADAYNYTYYTDGCTNFTFGSDESFLTINKSSSSVSIDFLPSSSETYGSETTSTCSIDSGDSTATLTLFRNESQIVQGSGNQNEQITLAAAIYNYSCTYDESENYTSSSTLNNYLTISKASPVVNLLLNGTDGDRNYNVSAIINSTIELMTPSGTSENVNLDTNITAWTLDSGATPHENMSSISTVGDYNFTGFWNGSENYTSGFETHYVTIGQPAYLEVVLVNPPSSLSVTRETNFTVNATVYCRDGTCGNVQGTVRYNLSSANPDTPVNTSSGGSPLYIQDSPQSALRSCGTNPLAQDEYCNISWVINATGPENSGWELGILFNSTASGISDDHTTNATITITHCSCDITLWSPAEIDFGTLNPNTNENAATGNSANDYNITVNEGSCDSNLWIKGEDLTNSTYGTIINIGNVTWSNSTDDYSSSYNMTTDYSLINMSVGERKRITTYYWINTPIILAGKYTGNVTIFANETE